MIPAPPLGDLGQRLLPVVLDRLALENPERVLYSVLKTKDPSQGFTDITAAQFARAVDRCAWHLHESLGPGNGFPTLAYVGPQDLVYGVLVLAAIKAGYKVLLISPRNALEAYLSLLEKTNCQTFLLPPKFPLPIIKQVLSAHMMRVLEIPSLPHWLEGTHKPYPYSKTFSQARSEPFAILHTSGSTGIPKPIVQTHGTIAPLDAFMSLPLQGLPTTWPAISTGKRVYLGFPLFHAAGISMLLPGCLFCSFTIVLGPFPPSAEQINSIHIHGRIDHSVLVPMSMIDLAKEPEYLENLGHLEAIVYGGGPCPPDVGNKIAQKTRVLNAIGTTECGVLPVELCPPADWSYLRFSTALGCEFRLVSDGIYEQVIVRRSELDLYQGVFQTFPELQEYPVNDLYTKHPTTEDLWLYKGRTDDIITFGNGEKLNPVGMESIISANPAVKGALIVGHGKLQSALLIEPIDDPLGDDESSQLLDTIWPTVEAANRISPSHAHVYRHMVIFTSPGKPMLRAGKGTVQRKLTLALYNAELATLYQSANDPGLSKGRNGSGLNIPAEEIVKDIVAATTGIDLESLGPDADLFEYGLDSLKIMVLAREINKLLISRGKPANFQVKTVYANHVLLQLLNTVSTLLGEGQGNVAPAEIDWPELYQQFSSSMPLTARTPQQANPRGKVVLLTGSTGSLGTYILDALGKTQDVVQIYCLNRGPDSRTRQFKSLSVKGLDLEDRPKVEFLDVNLSKPRFGLTKPDFLELLQNVTHIMHNAWTVDFNLSLRTFVPQVAATKQLIDFCANARFDVQLFFVSSVSTVSMASGPVEESIHRDDGLVEPSGYGKSKFVAEILLDDASVESGISTTVCRVGQIAGPTTDAGMWSRSEWLPSLIASSKYLGKLPESLGRMDTVDWIPVDKLGQILVELATGTQVRERPGAKAYHAVNPHKTSWSNLLPALKEALGDVDIVSLKDWVLELKASVSKIEDVSSNPAIKLLDFFTNLSNSSEKCGMDLEFKSTLLASKSMGQLEAVGSEWMSTWLRQWGISAP